MERRVPAEHFSIPLTRSTCQRPKNEDEAPALVKWHKEWLNRLQDETWVAYTDGSQSSAGQNGPGWFIESKQWGKWITECLGSCHLGESTEVIDDEVHAVDEALNYVLNTDARTKRPIICIDNLAAASLLENNTSQLEYIHAVFVLYLIECNCLLIAMIF
jgi:hypothetical protein